MDIKDEPSNELLNETYCESPLAVDCMEAMCLPDTISDVSSTNDAVMLVLPQSEVPNSYTLLSSESLDDVEEETYKEIDVKTFPPESPPPPVEIPKDLYTIHYSDKSSKSSKVTIEAITKSQKSLIKSNPHKMTAADMESLKHQSELHEIETTTRLEDFMDIVTTYKCKFCRFCCPWRSGLMSHIRNCHMNANKKNIETEVHNYALAPTDECNAPKKVRKVLELEEHGYSQPPHLSDDTVASSSSVKKDQSNYNASSPMVEKHVFICGQCSEGFQCLEDCKNHMIRDHQVELESKLAAGKAIVARKRICPKTKVLVHKNSKEVISEGSTAKSDEEAENNIVNNVQKRASRTPKNLEEDYYIENKKKRIRREDSAERPFRCNEKGCGYRFTDESSLHYHSSCHRSYYEKQFICPECGQCADNWRGLSVHLWKEHSVDIDLYTCDDCGYKTYSLFKLDNHKKIHSEKRQFVCQTCGKGFKQLSQLRNHAVIHTDRKNMTERRWYSEQKCEVCNRTFSDSKCLKKHQQAVHSKLKPFVCTYCGHMSARKAMLQLHMRQHTGEKPFTCEHCDYRTGDHNSLRRHRMRHTGLKPYKCPHCPYACIQAISYKTHLKKKHPGLEGLYSCSLCSFHSVSKENHLNHMSDHRRGAIPEINHAPTEETDKNTSHPTPMHLPENTLHHLEGMLPGNITAAQLIYSCLNALSQENGVIDLPPGVTTTSVIDGTQTITIQIPSSSNTNTDNEAEQFFLTVQQGEEAVLLPSTEVDDENSIDEETLQPITILNEGSFVDPSENSSDEKLVLSHALKC